MSLTATKVFYKKQRPKIARYRNYRNFDNELSINEVKNSIEQKYFQNQSLEFESFKKKVDNILQNHLLYIKPYVRANQAPVIDKNTNKHVMKRSSLCNNFLNTKSDIKAKADNTQRNSCASLIRQNKKPFLSNLNANVVTENKISQITVEPCLTDRVKTKSKITLTEKKYKVSATELSEEIISEAKKVAEVLNNVFVNIVPNLKILTNHNCNIDFQKTGDHSIKCNKQIQIPLSIVMIKGKIEPKNIYSFTLVQYKDILRKNKNLNVSKALKQNINQE